MMDFSAYIQSEWSWVVLFMMSLFVGMSKTGVQGLTKRDKEDDDTEEKARIVRLAKQEEIGVSLPLKTTRL